MSGTADLFDERSRPSFSERFRELARASNDIACALTRIRLTTLDLSAVDFERLEHGRVLVAELNALTLDSEARLMGVDPRRAHRVDLFRGLIESGRLEIRAAPLGGWSPDFTVFSDDRGPRAVMIGYHWLEYPFPLRGPALASVHGREAAERAAGRHGELWANAHDVGPAIWSILAKAGTRPATPLQRRTG